MILKKLWDFNEFYTVFVEDPKGGYTVLTYGELRRLKGQDYVEKFIKSFQKYKCGQNTNDDSLITLDVPENELDKVKDDVSKFKI